ncbi:hypothetical protein EDD22DRAFT_957383 [Suillus occidentalis]|nr:hypothetical protein EDD22DRAFT_957383 [Suillus occidentalis]
MVTKVNVAVYEPSSGLHAVLLYWGWASFEMATAAQHNPSGISEPPIPSPFSGIPVPLLRRIITVYTRSNRAQITGVEGVRFFAATKQDNVQIGKSTLAMLFVFHSQSLIYVTFITASLRERTPE